MSVLETLGRPDGARRALADGLSRMPPGDPYRAELEQRLQQRQP